MVTAPSGTMAGLEMSRMLPLMFTGVPKGALAGGKPAESEIAVLSPIGER